MVIDRRGTIYVPTGTGNRQIEDMKVKVIGADGKIRSDDAVHIQNARLGGVAVDSRGNIYVGAQAVPEDERIPKRFAGKLPEGSPAHHPSIDYMQNANLFKFPPTGGSILEDPDGTFTAIAQYRHANVTVNNALWIKRLGYIGSHGKELGCHCETTRFDIDGYDFLLVPDIFRFRIYALDASGNVITHFGSYGNMDSHGPGSPVPMPEIPFGWLLSAECARDKVYVADVTNKRVVAVRFDFEVSEECVIR